MGKQIHRVEKAEDMKSHTRAQGSSQDGYLIPWKPL